MTRTPPLLWDAPRQDVELAAGSSFTTGPNVKPGQGELKLQPLLLHMCLVGETGSDPPRRHLTPTPSELPGSRAQASYVAGSPRPSRPPNLVSASLVS